MKVKLMIILFVLSICSALAANPSFTGFSGAPASNGTCAQSCHAQNSFEANCSVQGFPDNYVPGQQYIIRVNHDGGSAICQFNCSIRADADSSIAGQIVAGTNMETYSTANELEGVHWNTTYKDSGTFTWTAPTAYTGPVTLFWAGLQGTRSVGADQQILLHAGEEFNSVDYMPELPNVFSLEQNYPNPFNQSTSIHAFVSRPGEIVFEVSNILGQRVKLISIANAQPGHYTFHWNGLNSDGSELPSGMYFYQLRSAEGNLTRKMTILR